MSAPRHIPVLGREAIALLAPREGGVYLDATFGAGGYTREILAVPGTRVIAIDRDPSAISGGAPLVAEADGRLTLVQGTFSQLAAICDAHGIAALDGIVMDVGVSSMQLDEAERGFSFRLDGPLDMRMGDSGPSAADVIARASEADLADVIYAFGEERQSRRIARAIVQARALTPITTTKALAEIVARVIRAKPNEIHPATRTFQALRILVNAELDELQAALVASEWMLKDGGRLAVVSFHSLEDRIVKTFLSQRGETRGGSRHLPDVAREEARFATLTKRPITASDEETRLNPRARSAKLRGAARTAAAAGADDPPAAWPRLRDVIGEH